LSLEAIKLICEAEDDAQQARELAQQKAWDLVNETERAGKDTVASTIARAETEIAHLIRVSNQKAMQQAKELASSTANREATQRARAERRLEHAAQLIVERIVNI
jgi:V/A-type H+-transporting ATPase subunit G/H